ncbi:MAG: diguanylate cyclase [Actinobacteria bacterium]|nr:diguanylate cyclase [Actinomycetota bacterium]
MEWQLFTSVYVMVAAAAITVTVAWFTLRRRGAPGAVPLVAINATGAFWALMSALELASASAGTAAIFHKVSFLAMDAIGIVWLAFAAQYAGRDRWITRNKLIIISALPAVTQVLLWTNKFHHLMFKSLVMKDIGGHSFLQKTPGAWWWVDSVYTYVLLVAGIVILGYMLIREFGVYRRQIAALLVGGIVPMVADFLYVQGIQGDETVNWAPAFFAWIGLALYWGFIRYGLLDVTPVAREFVAEHMGDGLIVTDTQDRTTYINRAAEGLLGKKLATVAGKSIEEVTVDLPGLREVYDDARRLVGTASCEWSLRDRYYDARVSPLEDNRDRVRGTILVLHDCTDRKVAEIALSEARQKMEDRVIERTAELAAEKEHLAHLNAVAVEIARCVTSAEVQNAGISLAREATGCEAGTLWLRSHSGGTQLLGNEGLRRDSWQKLRQLLDTSGEVEEAMAQGVPICIDWPAEEERAFERVAAIPLTSRGTNLGALCLLSCDSAFGTMNETLLLASAVASQIAVALENARRYEDAQFLAERDSLTRLLNHRGISKRLEQEVAHCERSGAHFGLVMIDVDNFKLFNDTHGHVVGDQVLQSVSRILTTSLRRSDIVARYGGDEFVALLPDASAESAVQLVERIRSCMRDAPFFVGDSRTVPIKMSYGIAVFPHDGHTAAEMLAASDANLYRSKRHGGDFITASGSDDINGSVGLGSFSVLDGLVTTVDGKDHYTRKHSDNVTEYSLALASKMGLSVETQRAVRVAALLHDVGKLGVPDHILRKPAELTEPEFEAIKNHVTLGELIIQGIPNQEEVLGAVGAHHERYDGKGYPRGLKGENIPPLGRLLAVTDAYSAMTTDRPYRKALSVREAKEELKRVAGTQLDPYLVKIFLEVLADEETREELRVAVYASGRP